MWEPELGTILSGIVLQKVYLSLCVLTGVVMCFYGYRAFKLALGLFGALLGGYAAAAVGFELSEGSMAVALFCGLTGGALGGVLMVTLYLLGVFVTGATLGGLLAAVFTIRAAPDVRVLVMSVLAAIGGFLALFVQRSIVIAATSLNGAALVVGGFWMLASRLSPGEAYKLYLAAGSAPGLGSGPGIDKYLLVGAWATLACLGAWAQFSAGEPPERPVKGGEEG